MDVTEAGLIAKAHAEKMGLTDVIVEEVRREIFGGNFYHKVTVKSKDLMYNATISEDGRVISWYKTSP